MVAGAVMMAMGQNGRRTIGLSASNSARLSYITRRLSSQVSLPYLRCSTMQEGHQFWPEISTWHRVHKKRPHWSQGTYALLAAWKKHVASPPSTAGSGNAA